MWATPLHRAFRSSLLLRNTIYGSLILLALTTLMYIKTPTSTTSIIPHYTQPSEPPRELEDVSIAEWVRRSVQVKQAFLHAYRNYERFAAPHDELKPLTQGKVDNFNGWGVSAFDSLDTMLLMNLDDEYTRALDLVKKVNFKKSEPRFVPFFETIIRYLGGLLSAYALSKDQILVSRAQDLAKALDPVFNKRTGMPYYSVDPSSGETLGPQLGILAEIASLQLEYTYLAKLTKSKHFLSRSQTLMKTLSSANLQHTGGMFPIQWNITSGEPFAYRLSVGAQADSAHEYLLKLYLLTGKKDKRSLEMYIRATTHIINNLLYLSPTRHLLYVTDSDMPTFDRASSTTHIFEHLSCFLPGLLALGAHTLPLNNLTRLGINLDVLGNEKLYGHVGKGYHRLKKYNLKELHMWAAEGLAKTCWITYADQPTGLGPDEIMMATVHKNVADANGDSYLWMDALDKWKKSGGHGVIPGLADHQPIIYTEFERSRGTGKGHDYELRKPGYLLRPETIESIYLMWRITGDWKWRARGWTIFEAIEKQTKTRYGYASVLSVDTVPPALSDSMPSYFLAETLKYLYLMFLEDDPVSLDKWVFNTEAHAFPVLV
ncbi:glycoside hydrolase family 47 protein [Pholiota conissans]|uniref:alpha-1,2-Mannosidase n=1 Tax=Pholiota conissans TaxID=109636 RepID=A0A9P5Z478_9AGAR|nr:glycoside hydrolase family 47 protein [Pholiota conissans]